MTPNEYLAALLDAQKLDEAELAALTEHRDEVEALLRQEFGSKPTIRYGGSKAKHTMIRESYDLDIVCYQPPEDDRSLKAIYEAARDALAKSYMLQPKASAIRILNLKPSSGVSNNHDYHVDVVPGRFVSNRSSDAFLHVSQGELERIQTNIETHISYISESGCREVIKLIKLWRCRHKLPGRTFVYEMFVVEELKGSKSKDDLEKSLLKVLEGLRDRLTAIRLVDPANTNNIISGLLTDSEKTSIAGAAEGSLKQIAESSSDPLIGWKAAFNDTTKSTESRGPTIITNPAKPWLEC
jgi:hypothetical protein